DSRQRPARSRFRIRSRSYERSRSAIDDCGTVSSSLYATKCRPDFRERFVRRGPNVSIRGEIFHTFRELNAARLVSLQRKCFARQRNNLARQKAFFLRRNRARKAHLSEAIHVLASN